MRTTWVSRVGIVALVGVLVLSVGLVRLVFMADRALAEKDGTDTEKVKNAPAAVPRVVDANNNVIGQVVGTGVEGQGVTGGNRNPFVALIIKGFPFVVGVAPDKLFGNAVLSFTTANCTGQAYFDVAIAPGVFPTVGVANGMLYGPRANTTPVAIFYQSYFQPSDPSRCEAPPGANNPINAYLADPIIDLSTQFTPPYRFVYN